MNVYATCCESAASSLAVTRYPPIASSDQVVKLLPQQGLLVGQTQIMPTGTPNQIQKTKQPQILPKPVPPCPSPQKQTVPRLNPVMPQQTPLLINQPQAQNPTLLLNQVLTSGAPVIVQPAGPGGTVHLMLRTPTPTLQSGPGPPGNKMIITNTTQPQPQATVLIQNRQQVVRFMTAQGPMQVQQIQTPSGPQLIAIPQNQSLSFPPSSVLVQGPTTNTLQLQQNSGSAIQLRQSPSTILQANSFPPNSLSNQIFQASATASVGLKLDEKPGSTDLPSSLPGANDQKKFVIDNKTSSKKIHNTLNNSGNFNSGNCNTSVNNLNNNLLNNIKKNSKTNKKAEDDVNRIGKTSAKDGSVPASTSQKNVTSTLRQIRPGAFVNRKNQNIERLDGKSLSNLAKIIDSVASNTEHLSSPPSPKVDNLTATINSVAENIKSPTQDDIMNINLNDVFISENKSLNLNKRPNLTIVQKKKPEPEEPMEINRLLLSPNTGMDFENMTKNYDDLELSAITSATSVQTGEPNFALEQNTGNQGAFQNQEETKKGKKKPAGKKKNKKEENSRVDLWDLMKSAGIGDDEFDDPSDVNLFPQDTSTTTTTTATTTITEPIEIAASDSDLLAQLQTASQLPGGIRVVVGEDGRPIIINGGNVLIPDSVANTSANCTTEPGTSEAVLQNMILPDNVFNFTPQAFATAQTQLNQLIQDHGSLATSSADQQLLSQIFGATQSIGSTCAGATTCSSTPLTQSTSTLSLPTIQSQAFPTSADLLVNVGPNNEIDQQSIVSQKPEPKTEFIGPPPGFPPLGSDSLVITNNNGVPTLVASPALMQYLQTHQGVIQFQHDPITKTIQPSLIIPHPQHKMDILSAQDGRTDKTTIVASIRPPVGQNKELNKPRTETKGCIGITKEDHKNSITVINSLVPNVIKQNMVKFVKDNPPLLQIATETNNLMNFKEVNKNLSDKERIEIEKKIQQNRAILDQCVPMDGNRTGALPSAGRVQNVIVKETGGDKSASGKTSTETQTLGDLQNLDMTLIKGFQPPQNVNSPNPNSDFQAKFLESIGMGNKSSKATVSIVTSLPTQTQSTTAKKSRKKKDKSQATQADVKTDGSNLTFSIAELTPEENAKLNQALQSRGAMANQMDNIEAIKQIIQEEVRKMTSNPSQNASIRFTNLEEKDDQSVPATNVLLSNANLNQLLDPTSGQGNVISLQGNELVAINSGSQQIFTSQNQILSGNHFVSTNNQILAIGGNPNQLVSLGSPIGSSNPIVALGSPPNVVSVGGNNIASQGAVIVGNNGNVVAIVHQNPNSGHSPGIVQRVQAIQLTTSKQQHFKTIQTQIQNLTSKANRTAAEQATLQKLLLEQQKLLSTAKIVPALPGQLQGMQIVSESIPNTGRVIQAQTAPQEQQSSLTQTLNQTQQTLQPQQQSQMVINNNTSNNSLNSQSFKGNWTAATQSISCGTNTSDLTSVLQNIPKISVPPTVLISDSATGNYGPLYVSPNNSNKNVTKCEKGTSPIQIQMGTQTVTNMEYRSGKMSTGTMTSPNTGKPQAVVAPAIVIQQTESQSPTYQMKPRNQTTATEPVRPQVPSLSRTAFIEQQMKTDKKGALMPDTRTPFLSKSDAVKRLIRYHVMDEKALSAQDLATADEIFEATAQHLLDKFRAMKEKYKYLLMMESMREVSTAERIMVDRNFIIEERLELEELREKEKRLQDEFENPTITCSNHNSSIVKTEGGEIKSEIKTEVIDLMEFDIKKEANEDGSEQMISKNRNSDNSSDLFKENAFKLTEANRNTELTKIKSETKECKNTRTQFGSAGDEELLNISAKCKVKTSRTFSDGSSKSSLDSSKDEDSGTDINAQVQSAIDSILNLQKCDTMSEVAEDGASTKRSRKKRKHWDKTLEGTKRSKTKGFGKGQGLGARSNEEEEEEEEEEDDDEEDNDGGDSDPDPILDEAIRSILTS